MKKVYLNLFIFLAGFSGLLAQAPQRINYQGVARDTQGIELSEKTISLQFSIVDDSPVGPTIYSELHAVTTDEYGLFAIEIGGGTTTDDFAAIDWGGGLKFFKVAMDINGGSSFVDMGTSQFLSTPYALYAESSGDRFWDKVGNNVIVENTMVGIGLSVPRADLDVIGTIRTDSIMITHDANEGYILTSDEFGIASWEAPFWVSNSSKLVHTGQVIINDTTLSPGILEYEFRVFSADSTRGTTGGGINYLTSAVASFEHAVRDPYDPTKIGPGIQVGNGYKAFAPNQNAAIQIFTTGDVFGNKSSVALTNISQGDWRADFAIQVEDGQNCCGQSQYMREVARFTHDGNVGIGTATPTAKLTVSDGAIYSTDSSEGVILTSPNGSCYRFTVDNAGNMSSTAIPCP